VSARSAAAQNAYIRQAIFQTGITGAKFRANLGQEDLINPGPNATASNRNKFITKETWLLAPSEWVETGTVKGWTSQNGSSSNQSYWAGSYYARQKVVNGVQSYFRAYTGNSGATGTPSYQVNYAGLVNGVPYWNFYVNGSFVGSLDHTKTQFNQMQIGIETNSTCSSFRNGTVSDSIQFRNSGGNWANWNTVSVGSYPLNPISTWSSQYVSAGNLVAFNRTANPANCP
jgi:hypothetical protein